MEPGPSAFMMLKRPSGMVSPTWMGMMCLLFCSGKGNIGACCAPDYGT
jgi:hypothetical protein